MDARVRTSQGFSLLDGMIVVSIVGLLAAVAIPQLTSPRDDGRTAELVSSLETLREAIDAYASQHDGFPGPSATQVADQLLKRTDKAGRARATDDQAFGPYLSAFGPYLSEGSLPTNPYTGTNSLKVVSRMPTEPSGPHAWLYCPSTGEIRGNAIGMSPDGQPLFNL